MSSDKMFVTYYFVVIAFCSLQLSNAAITPTKEIKETFSPIVYPGPSNNIINRYGNTDDDIPPECLNQTYCSVKPKNYPQELFDRMFKGNKASSPVLVISDDRNGESDETTDCDFEVLYEPLYQVKSERGWHIVAQSPKENYIQMVRIERCTGGLQSCFKQFKPPVDLESFCKQTHSYWEFAVLKPNGSGTEKLNVRLPVCCSCHYKIKET